MYRNYGPQVGGSRREMGGPPPMAPPSHAANTNDAPPTFKSSTFVYEHDLHGNVVAKYRCGRILGKGGFAKCYEVQDEHMKSFALKVVSNTMLEKPKTMQKLHSEIAIHRRMQHKHVVRFIRTFRDKYNVYMLLELCDSGTLMELLKVRPFSVAETQYVMLQCLSALQYMHENNVIHRDLKPGNIMLDADMNIKIGDFGLAAELHYDGERKRTVCGTPNYIAPEILDRRSQGHSFEVDTWSMGVILYTLLVGQPPFQMEDVESTYSRIRNCSYELPINIPDTARDLIQSILQSRPTNRPTLIDIRTHRFFASSPSSAPSTFLSLAHAPRGDHRGRPIAPAVAVQHGAERCGSAADPKRSRSSRDGRPREMLRPLSANAPVSGEPTSPRCHSAGAKINAAEPRRTPAMMMMDGAALRPPPPTSSGRVEGYVAASTAAPPSQPSTAMAHRRFSDRAPTIHPAAPPPTSTRFGGHFATPALPPPPSSHTNANANVGVRRPVVLDSARSPTTPTTASAGGLDELHHRTTRVAPTPAQPSSSAPAPADEDDERKELTTLHDQLHQTLLEAETRRGTSRPSSSSMRGGRGDAVAQPAEMSHKNNQQQQHQQHDEIKSEDEMKMLAEAPSVWVTHCADFSVKYGLGYYLSNGHVGAHFNDSTKLVWSPQSDEVEYFTRVKVEMRRRNGELGMYSRDQLQTFMMGQHGEEMDKKVLLIKYFRNYLERTHSGKEEVQVERCSCSISPPGRTGRRTPPTRGDLGETTVYVKRWLRTPEALVFRLSNKSVQVCFQDGGEVMLSSEWSVVSYSRPGSSQRRTFPLASVAMESEEANARLRDTKAILYNLIKEHYI